MTLIELLMVIVMLSITSVGAIDVFTNTLNEEHFAETKNKLIAIRQALVGDPSLMEAGIGGAGTASARSSFGYLGDIGAIPSATQGLAALWTNPGLPAYAVDAASRIGVGWNGPYLSVTNNSGIDYTRDGWGNLFVYSPTASPPTVASLGADGVAGGTGYDQDVTMELPANVLTATVYGVIVNTVTNPPSGAWAGTAQVSLSKPNGSGAITTVTTSIGDAANGAFNFTGVPIGIRSLTVTTPYPDPTQTLGPIVFSITSSNYLIPPTVIDLGK